MMIRKIIALIAPLIGAVTLTAQPTTTFEMRYLTGDAKADGLTDFHGPTEWLDTEQRVQVLNAYADFASSFWGDPKLDTPLFTDAQVAERTAQIKPQPSTSVRKTILLEQWRSCGYSKAKEQARNISRTQWTGNGVSVSDGCLLIDKGEKVTFDTDTIGWRFEMKIAFKDASKGLEVSLSDKDGGCIDVRLSDFKDNLGSVEIYGDFPNRVIFVSSEGNTLKQMKMPGTFGKHVTGFSLSSSAATVRIDDFSLYSFLRTPQTPRTPFVTVLHHDEDFNDIPCMEDWQTRDYDDSKWEIVTLPSSIGALKSEGDSYYLRTQVDVGDFKYASLEIETLDPAGEVWVNGEVAAVLKGRQPRSIDVSEYLKPNEKNTIAVRVKPYKAKNTMLHAPSDLNIGWMLGRTKLVLTPTTSHLVDNRVHTASLSSDAQAIQRHKITVRNETGFSEKAGLKVNYYPWFPDEGQCVASFSKDVELRPHVENVFDIDMPLDNPSVWTTSSPKLYKVEVILSDGDGNPIDDYVTTTGVRVIEQKNGVLYINHKPEMLNGAQNFGYRLPIEDTPATIRCGTDQMIMRDLMMAKRLGNLLRVHIHSEMDVVDGVNDPRFAEYADQMGLYLIWQSAGWLREGEVWNVDIENWPAYIRQVYNHPSIVLWEASNHPNRFKWHDRNDTEDYFNRIIPAIAGADTSRLISPTSFWQHSHYGVYDGSVDYQGNPMAPNPNLMHKMMTRGSQDAYTGYGYDWSVLRNFPYPWAKSCLDAKDLCYFNFEHEESAAQPNWTLAEKDPWYHVPSYEWEYEQGSIGRLLQFDEWRASQAFQAFSAWESMKLQTLAGVCGFSWCSLESGANMFTYQKPLVDPYYVPKLAFYANRMIFNPIWAASDDVDTVYGPNDMIRPVIFNLGQARNATLEVRLCDVKGRVIERKTFKDINVDEGRSVTRLEPFRFKSSREGCCFIEYKLSY